jgi:branched-subunit amino acid transport protein
VALWLTVIAMGGVTYTVRVAPILLLGRLDLPPFVLRGLRYVPAAVFSALVLPELLLRDGSLAIAPANPRLVAGLLASLVAWRTRNVFLTVAAGMAGLWAISAVLG